MFVDFAEDGMEIGLISDEQTNSICLRIGNACPTGSKMNHYHCIALQC